jgi:hypothetical protein
VSFNRASPSMDSCSLVASRRPGPLFRSSCARSGANLADGLPVRTRATRSGDSATTASRNSPANVINSSSGMELAQGNAAGSTAGSALAAISLVSKTARSCDIARVDSETIAAARSPLTHPGWGR